MKGIKKLLTGVLAATMIMSASITAFATSGEGSELPQTETTTAAATYNLTINDTRADRSFVAYQIITGDLSKNTNDELVLANMKWGSNVASVNQAAKTAGTELTEAELSELKALTDDAKVRAYAKTIVTSGNGYASSKVDGKYVISVPAGWYLIKETTENNGEDDFTSAFMMQVVGDNSINVKGSKTTVEKKVQDINDTQSATYDEALKDSADYDIGDEIPYTLTATLGNNLTDYETYELIFTDEMSKGLTFVSVDKLTIGNDVKETSNVVVSDGTVTKADRVTAGYTAKVFTIEDVLALGANPGDTVVINYTCKLNENAVIGSAGNPNYVTLEYSNDPASDEHGKTPEDVNIVFTFKVVINKVDENKKALSGAEFTLYKQVANSELEGAMTGKQIKAAITNPSVKASKLKDDANYVVVGNTTVDANGATFGFNGIDDGTYVLVETTIPLGYNAWESEEFIVTATHTDGDAPELTELKGGDFFTGDLAKIDVVTGTLTNGVINNSGLVLPSTGGMGTTIFYILGSILIVAGVAYFIVRRKASAE